ncbi:MAG TPA: hypothetical protein VFI38_00420 [Candidatus Acidoferrum sp.]|nr:hypothetical protein [Candidatus Acidoferrum sp.]
MEAPAHLHRTLRLLALLGIPLLFWGAWFHYAYRPVHRLPGPRLVYWAWERPEDLQFLDPKTEGVAFLASSVELLPDSVRIIPRMQPLLLPPGIQLVAVVRIYSHPAAHAKLNPRQFSEALQVALNAAHLPNVSALQIDFDARESERDFYSHLLSELRRQLGSSYPISITALASWCVGDRWIHQLPVNEAVPMLFSMGPDEPLIRHYLASVDTFPEPLCRGSLGISTGERWPNPVRSGTRVYVFNQQPWTREAAENIRSHIHRGM